MLGNERNRTVAVCMGVASAESNSTCNQSTDSLATLARNGSSVWLRNVIVCSIGSAAEWRSEIVIAAGLTCLAWLPGVAFALWTVVQR